MERKRVNIYSESSKDKSTLKRVNIIIGRFQPITLGHLKIVDEMYKENTLPTVICQVSNKKFDSKHPFSDELISEEVKIIEKNYKVVGQIYVSNADIVKCGNALHEAGFEPILWGCGTDRYANYTKQAEKYKKDADLLDEFTTFEVKRSDDDISATKVREALKAGDVETFNKMMPKGTDKLFDKMKEAIEGIKENTWVSLKDFVKESLEDDKKRIIDYIKKADEKQIKPFTKIINNSEIDFSTLEKWAYLKTASEPEEKQKSFYEQLKQIVTNNDSEIQFINLCKAQLDNKEDAYSDFNFDSVVGNIDIEDIIKNNSYFKEINIDTWKDIRNISIGPQPIIGKSELMLKCLLHTIKKSGNNSAGDIQIKDYNIELKDCANSNAKLGAKINTEYIYEFLGLKDKISIGELKAKSSKGTVTDKYLNNIKESCKKLNKESIKYFGEVFSEFKAKNLGKIVIDKLSSINAENDSEFLTEFKYVWGTFYLFEYAKRTNFDIFIVNAVKHTKDETKFKYNYINLKANPKNVFDEIIDKKPMIIQSISYTSEKKYMVITSK